MGISSGSDQVQLSFVPGLELPSGATDDLLLVASCAGIGDTWEKPYGEPSQGATTSRLGTFWLAPKCELGTVPLIPGMLKLCFGPIQHVVYAVLGVT